MFIARIGKYMIDLVTGPVVDAGYRVYEDVWQSHRSGKPVEERPGGRPRRSREKLISVHPTEQEACEAIEQLRASV